MILALILMLGGPATAHDAPTKVVKNITVDGQRFKVVRKGDQAEVTRKGMFFKADAAMHIAAIKAAEQATGCKVERDFSPAIGIVSVTLDCAE